LDPWLQPLLLLVLLQPLLLLAVPADTSVVSGQQWERQLQLLPQQHQFRVQSQCQLLSCMLLLLLLLEWSEVI
jgi:hypothetical protein